MGVQRGRAEGGGVILDLETLRPWHLGVCGQRGRLISVLQILRFCTWVIGSLGVCVDLCTEGGGVISDVQTLRFWHVGGCGQRGRAISDLQILKFCTWVVGHVQTCVQRGVG